MPRELETPEQIEEILGNGNFDQFFGVAENEILETKKEPWNFDSLDGKRQFAKDISAFANLRGGIILIGPQTEKDFFFEQDVIQEIRWLPESLAPKKSRYTHVMREWVYPPIDGFEVIWYEKPDDATRGIIAVHIPDQNDDQKPFLIAHSVNEAGTKNVDFVFGYVKRLSGDTIDATKEQLHSYLKNGMGWDPIMQKLDAILARVEEK